MRVLWVNERASFTGGCEQYVYDTAQLLSERGVHASLLYDCQHAFSKHFTDLFEHAFPIVDMATQIASLKPDLVYVHRLPERNTIAEICSTGAPVLRFFHDTQLFCPREHRYTAIGRAPCDRTIGMCCYFPCLGVVTRADNRFGVRFRPVYALRRELSVNRALKAFVVASHFMADLLEKHGFPGERIHVAPLYTPAPRENTGVIREPDMFLFAGQLLRSKGIDTLLRALPLMKHSCTLCLAGAGKQEGLFRALATQLGVASRVQFLGRIARGELCEWYARAACLVLPARQPESFGLVGPEAMSYGTPVIATRIGGVNMWLREGETGLFVPPNDPQALAKAMDTIVEDTALRERLGASARRDYQARFTADRHVASLLQLFQNVAEGAVS